MVLAESHERGCDESAMEYKMTAEHQLDLISRQIRGGKDKAICICATIAKGGGNNSVTYIVELYNTD